MRRRLEAQLELLEPHHKGIKLLLKKMTNIKTPQPYEEKEQLFVTFSKFDDLIIIVSDMFLVWCVFGIVVLVSVQKKWFCCF
ncbi:unnamed protein product [Linum tenue]|uniref:Uncharacterized protein n=1 Tax=Linum tenue TaxID=586396 RepID=A0AAV0NDJ7_9ROSI|nr:unnamed protein product [Linum tenue]CAI0457182.1 unnamed protein product [Linum tenue]